MKIHKSFPNRAGRAVAGLVGLAFVMLAALDAAAASAPVFASGPTIISYSDASTFPTNQSTLIFGYQYDTSGNRQLTILGSNGQGTVWSMWDGADHLAIYGGYDGDPGAAYVVRDGSIRCTSGSSVVMNCGHAWGGPGYMMCVRACPNFSPGGHYITIPVTAGPSQVGWGTFPDEASPVLVNYTDGGDYIFMFARGTNDQIWYAQYSVSGNSWAGWWQIPPPPNDHFISDPGATTYAAGPDKMIVCARLYTSYQFACTSQTGNPWQWSSWSQVPSQSSTYKPALARAYNSVFLFGVRSTTFWDQAYTTFPVGGGAWAGWSPVPWGNNFQSGPAVVARQYGPFNHAMAVGRGGDLRFWYATGGDSLGSMNWNGWYQIQASKM